MDNLDSITDPIEEVLHMMVKHQLAVVADKKLDLARTILRLQRQLTRTKETNKNFHEQWMYLHNTHEDIVGEVERVYGI
jgi:hypothetical protein|tara:strand:+ start:306 stop:542 length:237 start_codon:yes stop_codon:yes gene_type:complete